MEQAIEKEEEEEAKERVFKKIEFLVVRSPGKDSQEATTRGNSLLVLYALHHCADDRGAVLGSVPRRGRLGLCEGLVGQAAGQHCGLPREALAEEIGLFRIELGGILLHHEVKSVRHTSAARFVLGAIHPQQRGKSRKG